MSLDYPILPICQTPESFRNILSEMGPYRDSISLKKKSLIGSLYRLGGSIRLGYCVIPCFGGLCEERLPCLYLEILRGCIIHLWQQYPHVVFLRMPSSHACVQTPPCQVPSDPSWKLLSNGRGECILKEVHCTI